MRGWTVFGRPLGGYRAEHGLLALEVQATDELSLYRLCTDVELEARLAAGAGRVPPEASP